MLKFPRSLIARPRILVGVLAAIVFIIAIVFLARPGDEQAAPVPNAKATEPAKPLIAPLAPILNPKPAEASADRPSGIQQFATWLQRFNESDPATRAQMASQGVELAQARRAEMKALVRKDPEAALAATIRPEARSFLPPSIEGLLERPVREVGSFNVNCVTPMRGQPELPYSRSVTFSGRSYTAYVYGGMAQMPSLQNVALTGVALDDDFALADIPQSRLRAFGDPSVGSSDVTGRPIPSWTVGPKRVLIIRVDFPDLQGEPVYLYNNSIVLTTNYIYNLFNQSNGIADFFRQNS